MDELEHVLERVADAQLRQPGVPAVLREAILYSLLAPGKRLRPRLTLAASRLVGIRDGAAWQAAAAIEALHCASLIHDDLPAMDDAESRRGRPSNHRVHGEANAILAGDALIVMGFEMLADAARFGCEPDCVQRASKRLFRAYGPAGLAGGQAAELAGVRSAEELAEVRRKKTTVLFEASVLIPTDLAGLPPEAPQSRALAELGCALGEAFQIADDLEDVAHDRADANVCRYPGAARQVVVASRRLTAAAGALASQFGLAAMPIMTIADDLVARLHAHAARTTPVGDARVHGGEHP